MEAVSKPKFFSRVVLAVAHQHPHRPGRAQLTHPVPQVIRLWLGSACKLNV